MPVDWHGVRHTVVTYSNVDEMALLERMLQGSRELIPNDMTSKTIYLFYLKCSKLEVQYFGIPIHP